MQVSCDRQAACKKLALPAGKLDEFDRSRARPGAVASDGCWIWVCEIAMDVVHGCCRNIEVAEIKPLCSARPTAFYYAQ